ncbi:Hypothetical predicted protein [Podarcis lilfordi]|uniref:Uncharacterized protein n=1 Tax=Podarcis lilfordi TaxID=74358 RepID=A0AA35NZV0_9SAUR|nr:Hypothetical predicted protein [Podarcis lilfordi]
MKKDPLSPSSNTAECPLVPCRSPKPRQPQITAVSAAQLVLTGGPFQQPAASCGGIGLPGGKGMESGRDSKSLRSLVMGICSVFTGLLPPGLQVCVQSRALDLVLSSSLSQNMRFHNMNLIIRRRKNIMNYCSRWRVSFQAVTILQTLLFCYFVALTGKVKLMRLTDLFLFHLTELRQGDVCPKAAPILSERESLEDPKHVLFLLAMQLRKLEEQPRNIRRSLNFQVGTAKICSPRNTPSYSWDLAPVCASMKEADMLCETLAPLTIPGDERILFDDCSPMASPEGICAASAMTEPDTQSLTSSDCLKGVASECLPGSSSIAAAHASKKDSASEANAAFPEMIRLDDLAQRDLCTGQTLSMPVCEFTLKSQGLC